jgi:hypothetical protein
MELALATDGPLATIRIAGVVKMSETGMLSDYLRVARENGAVRCVLDLSACRELPTTIMALLMRESSAFAAAGGALSLTGVGEQNPFLTEAVAESRFLHYRTVEEAIANERVRAAARPIDAAGTLPDNPALRG